MNRPSDLYAPLIAAVIALLIVIAWTFRYEYHSGPLGLPLRTNRWTGQLEKFWGDEEKGLPVDWYPVPMGAASRREQTAARQEKEDLKRREQAERDEQAWDWEHRGRFAQPLLPPSLPPYPRSPGLPPTPGIPPGYQPSRPPSRWAPLPPPSISPPGWRNSAAPTALGPRAQRY